MPFAFYTSLFFTAFLLMITAYFLMGGLPLLTLKHDTQTDASFVRGFFKVYYQLIFAAALGAALSYALWGKPVLALGSVAVALVAWALRKSIIPAMQRLDAQIQSKDDSAIQGFRKVHSTALLCNFVQLVVLVWATVTQFAK
jgi:hypothetical protein